MHMQGVAFHTQRAPGALRTEINRPLQQHSGRLLYTLAPGNKALQGSIARLGQLSFSRRTAQHEVNHLQYVNILALLPFLTLTVGPLWCATLQLQRWHHGAAATEGATLEKSGNADAAPYTGIKEQLVGLGCFCCVASSVLCCAVAPRQRALSTILAGGRKL